MGSGDLYQPSTAQEMVNKRGRGLRQWPPPPPDTASRNNNELDPPRGPQPQRQRPFVFWIVRRTPPEAGGAGPTTGATSIVVQPLTRDPLMDVGLRPAINS
ncbi:unnamed protein product [Boreogadus saida]